jgi:hypothetical protein
MAGSGQNTAGSRRKAGGLVGEARRYGQFIRSAAVPSRQEDWGNKARGQGRRIGGRLVVGAMASVPTGRRSYPDFQRARGMTPAVWREARLMSDEGKRAVIGALQSGWSADRALTLAYRFEP